MPSRQQRLPQDKAPLARASTDTQSAMLLPEWVEEALREWPTLDTMLPIQEGHLTLTRLYIHCRRCRTRLEDSRLHARLRHVRNWLCVDMAAVCPGCSAITGAESRHHPDGRVHAKPFNDRWHFETTRNYFPAFRPSTILLTTALRRCPLTPSVLKSLQALDWLLAGLGACVLAMWLTAR